jgi:hypothetical protein
MFCLSLDGFEESLVDEMVHRESLNTLALDGYRLLWRDNDRVHIEQTKHHLRILMDDPAVGARNEYLRVDFASRRVSAHRPWPGSKSIYFRSKNGLLITTHLRLAAGYGATHGPAPRLMNAGETITFQREGHRHASRPHRNIEAWTSQDDMVLEPTTKLAGVRRAMAAGDWEQAIKLASKLRSLGRHQKAIDRAKDFLNNPTTYEQLGYDRTQVIDAAIAALKDKFSKSWEAVQEGKIDPGAFGRAGDKKSDRKA